jgi:Transposase DDE domain
LREAKQRLEAERAANPQPVPRSRPKRVREAKRRLEEELFTEVHANRAYEAYRARGRMKDGRRLGRAPDPYQPPATPEGRINVTDPDSHVVKGLRGFLQGYNAQAVTNEHQVVLAAEIETVGADFGHLEPMLDAAQRELTTAGIDELPEVLLADAGYWHGEQMQRIVDRGIQVLIPPDTSRRRTTRRNWDGGRYDEMRRVLASDPGRELYGKRQPMIEPVFAQMQFNRRLDRFRRRGRGAVHAQWRLITATHNLLKLHRHALAVA